MVFLFRHIVIEIIHTIQVIMLNIYIFPSDFKNLKLWFYDVKKRETDTSMSSAISLT